MAILDTINSPEDLRRLDQPQLAQLAQEVRAFLVEQTSRSGGHLSPHLGVVELTFALHRVFESPKDAIVWDTGHQAYVHKIVTGRAKDFARLRQAGGLSGYPSRQESEHDLVENSHASTSLSYALGISEARLRKKKAGHVVAVIGDGALTGGMAYEALNQIAHLQPPNLIIVINDNGRSYAPTVGGLARHLSQLRIDPRYERIKVEISRLLSGLPLVGSTADQAAYRVKESLKQLLQPSTVFDLSYLRLIPNLRVAAPADATELCALLETALDLDGPIAIRYPKGPVPATPDLPVEPLPVGRWEERRKGSDAAIFAIGRMVEVATEAAERLALQGVECTVVNARWIKPIDPRIVDWARRHPVVLTVEDNVGAGGFGGAVLEALAPHGLAGRVRNLALPDQFLPQGKAADILRANGLDAAGIAQATYNAIKGTVASETGSA